jgi:membrane-associated protease RseP (regulator of RpoE activity)
MSEQRHPYFDVEFPASRPTPRSVWSRPEVPEPQPKPRNPRINALLFVATTISVFVQGAYYPNVDSWGDVLRTPIRELFLDTLTGWTFAVPLLGILLFHEFGHYIAARLHRVDASLPYFIPLPILSPFGTMGAVIAMQGRIRSRNALLDIGASGPLAGLVVALPVLAIGLSLSTVGPNPTGHYMQEGQSLLYLAIKRLVLGPIPDGYDVQLHPTAFAGWAGLFVTLINLLPWGQLDGGHVAYALFGKRQDGFARYVRLALLPLFVYNLAVFTLPVALGHSHLPMAVAVGNSLFWLMWYGVTGLIGRLSGGAPTEPGELSPVRRVIAIITLIFFVLLFMPTPLSSF